MIDDRGMTAAERMRRLHPLQPARRAAATSLEVLSRVLGRPIRVTTRTFWGQRITVELPEPISIAIFRDGYIEPDVTAALLRHLREGSVFFDVGAHVGYFTALASRLVGPTGTVVAFEPTPSSRSLLERNLASAANVVVEPVAAWSADTTLAFNDFGWRFSALNSVFAPRSRPDEPVPKPQVYDVEAIRLDTYAERSSLYPDVVKIDAESADYEVLRGMDRILSDARPVVTVEVGDVDIPGAPEARSALSYLVERGYEPFDYIDGEPRTHRITDRYAHGNVVLVPRS